MTCVEKKHKKQHFLKMGLFSLRLHTADVMCVFFICVSTALTLLVSVFVIGLVCVLSAVVCAFACASACMLQVLPVSVLVCLCFYLYVCVSIDLVVWTCVCVFPVLLY